MTKTGSYVLLALQAGAALVGCQSVTDLDHNHPGCDPWYNQKWQDSVRSQINHSDPRTCPLGLNYGQQGQSGALVYDLLAVYPTTPSSIWLTVGMYDYSTGVDHQCSVNIGYPSTVPFAWGQPRSGSSAPYEWQAEQYVQFVASYNPDYLCLDVDFWSVGDARAVVSINYYGIQARLLAPGRPGS